MKKLLFILISLSSFGAFAQTGNLQGNIQDKEYAGNPLPFADVYVKGTTKGATTDFDGNYLIENIDAGTQTLVISFVGYETKEVTVNILDGQTNTHNDELGADAAALKEVVVQGVAEVKESEAALLTEQKKAVEIVKSIGAEELSKKGVSNVEGALNKVTGISRQEGSGREGVFVRGLGDRYNITTYNGLPLPSNNPSKKNIDLDIFNTNIIESVGVDKTFQVKNYADFAGASININSKDFKGKPFIRISGSTGVNQQVFEQDDFYMSQGPNFTGFYNKEYPNDPLNAYRFNTSWNREKSGMPVNSSLALDGGFKTNVGSLKLSNYSLVSFGNNYNYRETVNRANVNVQGLVFKDLYKTSYVYNTNFTAMSNFGFKFGQNKIKLNALYINSSQQNQDEYTGIINIFDYATNGGAFIQRQTYEQVGVGVLQLLGEHKITEKFKLKWGGSANLVDDDMPDRRQLTLVPDNDSDVNGPKSFKETLADTDNHRYYQNLSETEYAANFSAEYKFGENENFDYKGKVTLGYSGRFKEVDFEAIQFNFNTLNWDYNNDPYPLINDVYNLDYFNQENFDLGLYDIRTYRGNRFVNPEVIDVLEPQTYGGEQIINAAFGSFEYKFSEKITSIIGVRIENVYTNLNWDTAVSPNQEREYDDTFVLPSLALKYKINEKQNLKLAASKTYTQPQFKERARFQFDDVLGVYVGNEELYASENYNGDLLWEYFPSRGEVISAGYFIKYIENPINEVYINSAAQTQSWVNSGDRALAHGIEAEFRKKIIDNEVDKENYLLTENLTFGLNIAYMITNTQDLSSDKVEEETPYSVDFSEQTTGLAGASNLIINSDISYYKKFTEYKDLQATLTYNYFSDRIAVIFSEGRGNHIDRGYGTLDFVIKTGITKNLSLGLNAMNLLDERVKRIQENQDVVLSDYRLGRTFKLSFAYKF